MDNKHSNSAHNRELYGCTGQYTHVHTYNGAEDACRVRGASSAGGMQTGRLQSIKEIARHIEDNGCIGVQAV